MNPYIATGNYYLAARSEIAGKVFLDILKNIVPSSDVTSGNGTATLEYCVISWNTKSQIAKYAVSAGNQPQNENSTFHYFEDLADVLEHILKTYW